MLYEVKNISYTYPNSEKMVLKGVSMSISKGEILSILGPNGSGKSTLLNCLAGIIKPTQGQILLDGQDISKMSGRQIARKIGYVQQTHIPTFAYSVFEFVLMGRAPKISFFGRPQKMDEELVWQTLEMLNITHLANRPYTKLSGGERQQCIIAHVLVQEPQAILFDEPTAFLDYGNQVRILRLIKSLAAQGYTIIMTTHNPDHAVLLGGKTALFQQTGELSCGRTGDIITEENLQQIYRTELRLLYIDALQRQACLHAKL
ncbi:MAG: ABC transporter ATP-binding protein [Firmicutes bacterium]|jgi:iron complex transport system ATP-binding protein|nr:ABC transporter ATP-binding protein [Bacillota bacterium]